MTTWLIIVGLYALMSAATFVAYGIDKRAARRNARRTRERTLHTLELLGGWPGALLAQRCFRHKTRDRSHLPVLWLIIAAHIAGWALCLFLRR